MNTTVTVALFPGLSTGVFFPAIVKLWATLPRLTTWKAVLPVRTVVFESEKAYSVGFPAVTVIVPAAACVRPDAGAAAKAKNTPATIQGTSVEARRIDLRSIDPL